MYIDTGKKNIRAKDVIGIFDLDRATRKTGEFLSKAEKDGIAERHWTDLPRSFIVTADRVYYAQATVATLLAK